MKEEKSPGLQDIMVRISKSRQVQECLPSSPVMSYDLNREKRVFEIAGFNSLLIILYAYGAAWLTISFFFKHLADQQ